MLSIDLEPQTPAALLRLYALILDELRRRHLVRSTNNPVADLAELIGAKALDLQLVAKSTAGHDAIDRAGLRYQIKARRITAHNRSRQLSFIRKMETRPFDYVLGILFAADFAVFRAALVPYDIVRQRSSFVASVSAYRFLLSDDVWDDPNVDDLTEQAKSAAQAVGCR